MLNLNIHMGQFVNKLKLKCRNLISQNQDRIQSPRNMLFTEQIYRATIGFSGEEVFSPLTNLALRKFDRQYYDSKICQIPKRTKNQANF